MFLGQAVGAQGAPREDLLRATVRLSAMLETGTSLGELGTQEVEILTQAKLVGIGGGKVPAEIEALLQSLEHARAIWLTSSKRSCETMATPECKAALSDDLRFLGITSDNVLAQEYVRDALSVVAKRADSAIGVLTQ